MLAAGLQSVDTDNSFEQFSLTGIGMCDDDITFLFLRFGGSESGGRHRKMETVKITRMRTLYKKLREGW
jgi:hypothetical protein